MAINAEAAKSLSKDGSIRSRTNTVVSSPGLWKDGSALSQSFEISRDGSIKSLNRRSQPPILNSHIDSSSAAGPHDDDSLLHPEVGSCSSPVFLGHRSKSEGKLVSLDQTNKSPQTPDASGTPPPAPTKLSKRESLKVQKKHYRREKKRAAKELLCTLKDPSVIVLADWLKVRGTLKGWTKLWCVLKPGLLVLYKSHKQKSSHWVGTILLNTCELIERPSKKDGFCFKLFHPLDQSIWATKLNFQGPKGETMGAWTQPLPYSYLIFRALSEAAGKCWMDALELALRCSSLLMRSMTKDKEDKDVPGTPTPSETFVNDSFLTASFNISRQDQMNESDCERHFKDCVGEDYRTDREENKSEKSDSDSDQSDEEEEKLYDENLQPVETDYIENIESLDDLGQQGDAYQTEEVADENKSLIWTLVKQVRPGMDLSKVVLPTFILEPRSFLDKLSDNYYHSDFLSEAVLQENPFLRMKMVARWYLSGFYKKPKGLKKPYNPILGETFRCYWKNPKTGSRTFYVAEQISHHPPVSAFYVTNRQDGFQIAGSILAKSKFYGNSLSAILDGAARLTFLKRGEDYNITMPYAHCKGILIGTLTMEYGGKVMLDCEKTGYRCEMEFKLRPFLGSGEASNKITGKIKLGTETLATLDGRWDSEVYIKDRATGDTSLFWNPTQEVKQNRLKRYTVPLENQGDFESEHLWMHVSEAIAKGDQEDATHEKFLLEEAQRNGMKERKAKMMEWNPKFFERDMVTGDWIYKFTDSRPWDPINDLLQYECDYVIQTKTRHKTPIIRATSILSVEESALSKISHKAKKSQSLERVRAAARMKQKNLSKHLCEVGPESGSSTPDPEVFNLGESDSSDFCADDRQDAMRNCRAVTVDNIDKLIQPIIKLQQKNCEKLSCLQGQFLNMQRQQVSSQENAGYIQTKDWLLLAVFLVFQTVLSWIFR
ncbi:oxysterol-binding protein-related protein 8-like isoform X3 [Lineus longissimus]|uniref:oxysterol-binding protein-related protein 8-like isoform X3 n=1 Tax=Lineus longissimus TaxID=88925 RepID=UPI00315CA2DF